MHCVGMIQGCLTAALQNAYLCPSGWSQSCQNQDMGWEKIAGAKPANAMETVFYRNSVMSIGNNGIIAPCFNR